MQQALKTAANAEQKQRILGEKGLIALLALLSAFVPLSTDLYLPSLPGMARYFQAPVHLANLTLILFFIFYSTGILVWGPLSDKYGRKPVLLTGLTAYTIASLFCANAWNIYALIAFRVLQAIGGSAASAVSTAIVKDIYSGRKRETVLAIVQSMMLIAPAVVPVVGAFLLTFTSWRGAFWTLTGIGLVALAGTLAFEETVVFRYEGSIGEALGRLWAVLKNPGFTSLLIIFSIISFSSLAFVASSSYIYIDGFGLSAQAYSFYFALNAVGLISGPMLYLQLSKSFRRRAIITACFATTAASGLLICFFGSLRPWLFAASVLPATVAGSCVRPPGTNLMLEQQQRDTGSASSLIGCSGFFMGSIGMSIISLDWGNTIRALGLMYLATGLISLTLWQLLSSRPFVKQGQS
ncbi:MAG: multidrug effflux MFS transporter [Thermacetogeniaceae bacterium]